MGQKWRKRRLKARRKGKSISAVGARGKKRGKGNSGNKRIIVTSVTKRSYRDAGGDRKRRTIIIDCKHNRGAR